MIEERHRPAWSVQGATGPVGPSWHEPLARHRTSTVEWPPLGPPAGPARPIAGPGEPEAPSDAPLHRPSLLFDEAEIARIAAAVETAVRDDERRRSAASQEARIADALAAIGDHVAGLDAAIDTRRASLREAAVTIAAAVGEALCGAGAVVMAKRLAQALAEECLARLDPDVDIVVEAPAGIAESLSARLAGLSSRLRRSGRLEVRPAAETVEAVRVAWPDGCAEWSADELRGRAAAILGKLAREAAGGERRPTTSTSR